MIVLLAPFASAEMIGSHQEGVPCIDEAKRCDYNVLQECINRSWTIIEECSYTERCDKANGCEPRALAVKGPGQNAIEALQNEPYVQKFIPVSEENKTYGIKNPMPKINLTVAYNATIIQSSDENVMIIMETADEAVVQPVKKPAVEKPVKKFELREIPLVAKANDIARIAAWLVLGKTF
jgi:hypothetical protein